MAPCDTLAAQFIGGFKEGVGFAVKQCRTCEITKSEVKHSYFLGSAERTLEKHNERIENLEEVSKKTKVYWRKMWDIDAKKCLVHNRKFSLAPVPCA